MYRFSMSGRACVLFTQISAVKYLRGSNEERKKILRNKNDAFEKSMVSDQTEIIDSLATPILFY